MALSGTGLMHKRERINRGTSQVLHVPTAVDLSDTIAVEKQDHG